MQAQSKTTIYLIPGQGSDYRLFKNLSLDTDYDTAYIHYQTPPEGSSMRAFARELSKQIDTSGPFILVGVSLGGMLAVEMSQFLSPEKTIVISSAKNRKELPYRYRFQSKVPVYKLVSGKMSKKGALFLQPIVEPDRNKESATCEAMLGDKDPLFLRRTIEMILNWERTSSPEGIIHIHGDNDNTIPIRNVSCNYVIKNGSHMMVLTKANEVSRIINEILKSQ